MSTSTAPTPLDTGRLVPGPRPTMSFGQRLSAAMTHHWAVYRRTWRGTLIERFLSPLLFLGSLGLGLGALVDRGSGGVGGVPYLQFVVPGIIAYQGAMLGFAESAWPVLGYFKWTKMYAAKAATPLHVGDILLGHVAVLAFQVAVATAVFVAVAAVFGAFASWWIVLAVPIGLLVGLAFATPMFAVSARVQDDSIYGILGRFVLTPILLFSGTFFPISQLPPWLEPLAWVTPLWHGVVLMRSAAAGVWPGPTAWLHLAALLIFIVGGYLLALRGFRRRLRS